MELPSVQISAARPHPDSSATTLAKGLVPRWPEWIALALYTALIGVSIPYHEPWVDEAQAWQLARSLSLHNLFGTYLRYEDSPGLWHALLWMMARFHVSYSEMHWVSGCIAVAGVSVLLFCSPFHRYIRLLLPFTYFLAFQYAVVARNYVLVPLLLFAMAALWRKSPILVALLLGLLGNVALHALAISGGLAIVYIIERQQSRKHGEDTSRRREFIAASCLLIAFYGFAIWTILPPADVYVGNVTAPVGVHGIRLLGGWLGGLLRVCISLLYGVTEPMPFAIPLWIAIVYAMRRRHQAFYLLPAVTFALFSLVYLMFWHAGLVIPMMIAVFWIAGVNGPTLRWPTTTEATAVLATVIYLFTVQIGWTVHAVTFDHFHAYSPDRATASFLKPYVNDGDEIAITYATGEGGKSANAVGILPYFSRQIYMNLDKTFWWWSIKNTTDTNFEHALSERPPIVELEYFDPIASSLFTPSSVLANPKAKRVSNAGYGLTHIFCGEQPVRFAYEFEICHVIFQQNKGAKAKRP